MSVIVSANYRDRSQKNWLVRQKDDPLEKFELRERVVIRDFKFCPSLNGEDGFGCQVVAVGEPEEVAVDREKLVRISFNGAWFTEYVDGGVVVKGGSLLVLDDTGMYYLPA